MTSDLATFEAWLKTNGHRWATRERYVQNVKSLLKQKGANPPSIANYSKRSRRLYAIAWDWWRKFNKETTGITDLLPIERLPSSYKRVQIARSFSDADWHALIDATSASSSVEDTDGAADTVLYVMSVTGLRVGDVLRADRSTLEPIYLATEDVISWPVKGGKERVVVLDRESQLPAVQKLARLLLDSVAPNVAARVSPSGSPDYRASRSAYKVIDKRLKELAIQLRLTGRPHLHRLRRTIAMVVLRGSNGNAAEVRDALGHTSDQTALRHYLDEFQGESAARTIGRSIRREKGPTTP